jgi:hypothetical protein
MFGYWITSSARRTSDGEMFTSALAVFDLGGGLPSYGPDVVDHEAQFDVLRLAPVGEHLNGELQSVIAPYAPVRPCRSILWVRGMPGTVHGPHASQFASAVAFCNNSNVVLSFPFFAAAGTPWPSDLKT